MSPLRPLPCSSQCQSLQKQLLSSVNRCARLELDMDEAKARVAQVEVSATGHDMVRVTVT